jgi:hypothetical protein
MTQAAIIPFYPHRIPLANQVVVPGKGRQKTIPAVDRHRIVRYSQPFYPFPQLLSGF